MYWQAAYPSANGIEGVGRLVIGGAATLGNALLASLGAFALLGRRAQWVRSCPPAWSRFSGYHSFSAVEWAAAAMIRQRVRERHRKQCSLTDVGNCLGSQAIVGSAKSE